MATLAPPPPRTALPGAEPPRAERPGSAVSAPPVTPVPARPVPVPWAETRILLHGVPWELYERLRDLPENRHVRLTYDRGDLEIEVPTGVPHENVLWLLGAIIGEFAEMRDVEFRPTGSASWDRPDLPRGLRGDATFYIQHFDAVRGKDQPDLAAGDPPPDLAVEVVFSSPLLNKAAIYAALGVPELWTWRDGAITVRVLNEAGEYEPAADSRALPGFPFALAAGLLERRAEAGQNELLREFRAGL